MTAAFCFFETTKEIICAMSLLDLPPEIVLKIAMLAPDCWRAMLTIESFGLWSLTPAAKKIAEKEFYRAHATTRKETPYFNDKFAPESWLEIERKKDNKRFEHTFSAPILQYKVLGNVLHSRDDSPALVVLSTKLEETKIWYKRGRLHREDGPAYVTTRCGITLEEIWAKDGRVHRADGPAILWRETKTWVVDGQFHWEDGPAYVSRCRDLFVKRNDLQRCEEKTYDEGVFGNELFENGTRVCVSVLGEDCAKKITSHFCGEICRKSVWSRLNEAIDLFCRCANDFARVVRIIENPQLFVKNKIILRWKKYRLWAAPHIWRKETDRDRYVFREGKQTKMDRRFDPTLFAESSREV